MNKSKALKSAIKNEYIKKLNSLDEVKSAVNTFLARTKNDGGCPELIVVDNSLVGVRVFKGTDGKFVAEEYRA